MFYKVVEVRKKRRITKNIARDEERGENTRERRKKGGELEGHPEEGSNQGEKFNFFYKGG